MEFISRWCSRLKSKYVNYFGLKASRYVYYKIVDMPRDHEYIIQCVNTKSIFKATVLDIVFNNDILYGLHPLQSCYVGMEYAFYLKNNNSVLHNKTNETKYCHPLDYGDLKINYQDRDKNICYVDTTTQDKFVLDPIEIATSSHLIKRFSSEHAFFIGFSSAIKRKNTVKKIMTNYSDNVIHVNFNHDDHSIL